MNENYKIGKKWSKEKLSIKLTASTTSVIISKVY